MLGQYEIPIGNIVTALSTLIAVYIGNRLSSSQSGSAKIWDLRRPAYGKIIAALSAVERLCDSAEDAISEDIHRYHDDGHRAYIDEKISDNMAVASAVFNDDYLIFSDKFISVFGRFTSDIGKTDPHEGFPADHEQFASIIRKYRPLLLTQGRREMTKRHFHGWDCRSDKIPKAENVP